MHEIRLRRPWRKQLEGQTESQRIDVPDADSDSSSRSVTYQRTFNRPPRLSESARVHLRIEAWQGRLVALTINNHPLAIDSQPLTLEITEWLQPHCRIMLQLAATEQQPPCLSGEVTLLIEE